MPLVLTNFVLLADHKIPIAAECCGPGVAFWCTLRPVRALVIEVLTIQIMCETPKFVFRMLEETLTQDVAIFTDHMVTVSLS